MRVRTTESSKSGNRLTRIAAVALLAVIVALPPVAGAADEKPTTTYTRVALWQVERAYWGDFVEMFEAFDQPIMEKLMAEGLISEWGIDAEALHHAEGYTHTTWYSAGSLGAVMEAGKAYDAAWQAMGEEKMKAADAKFAAMISLHRDVLIATENMRTAAATLDGGYYHGHHIEVTRGKGQEFKSYWEHRIEPVYHELFEKGIIVAYGLSREEITTEAPMAHTVWYMVRDGAGLDAVKAAFEARSDGMNEEERRARWTSFMDVVEEDSYREYFTSLIHWSSTAH